MKVCVEGRITIRQGADTATIARDRNNKEVVFKSLAPFICISKVNDAEVDLKILILWCQCIIYYNIVKIMQKHQLVYGNIVMMNQMKI